MTKFIRLIQNYLLCALPLVIICMIWSSFSSEYLILNNATLTTKILWEVLSWNLMLWFLVLTLFLLSLIISPKARELTLKRLANIKERDEREQFITGQASRSTYIATLSLMIFFLFLSIFTLSVYRTSEAEAINGKTGKVSIGLNFNLIDTKPVTSQTQNQVLFETKDIPLSKTAIVLIFIIWQLMVFNITARRKSSIN